MATKKLHYSFIPGLNKIKAGDIKNFREELKKVLDIKTSRDYFQKRKDYVNIPAHYKVWVEDLFCAYGVIQDIWSITDDNGDNVEL